MKHKFNIHATGSLYEHPFALNFKVDWERGRAERNTNLVRKERRKVPTRMIFLALKARGASLPKVVWIYDFTILKYVF